MKEVKFTQPLDHEHTGFEKELCLAAGGFTKVEVTGGWFDPDLQEIVVEPNWQYTVAVGDSAIEDRVFRLARLHNAGLGESALYFVHANGVATITTH